MPPYRTDPFSRALARIYDAAHDSDAWPDALTSLAELFSSRTAWFFDVSPRDRRIRRSSPVDIDSQLLHEYDAHYVQTCPRLSYYINNPERRFYFDHLHTNERNIDRSEYYAWLSRFQMRYYFAMRVSSEAARPILLTFHRHRSRGHVTPTDLKLAESVVPHIERALSIAADLQNAALRIAAHGQITNKTSHGTVVVDPSLKVLRATPDSEKVLVKEDGLMVRRGHLAARTPRDHDALRTSVAAATRAQRAAAVGWRTSISIGRANGSRAYTLVVTPFHSEKLTPTVGQSAIALHIFESARQAFDVHSIARRIGLTIAEAEIVGALASGETVSEYAKRVGRSDHTIRWHLKRAMAKTRTSRQVALVRRVLSLAPEL